jgi:hypothetical protein
MCSDKTMFDSLIKIIVVFMFVEILKYYLIRIYTIQFIFIQYLMVIFKIQITNKTLTHHLNGMLPIPQNGKFWLDKPYW